MKKNTYSVQAWSKDGNIQYGEITALGLKRALKEYNIMKDQFTGKDGYIEIVNISNEENPKSWYRIRYSKL